MRTITLYHSIAARAVATAGLPIDLKLKYCKITLTMYGLFASTL